jgi:site-specific DNA recombinase
LDVTLLCDTGRVTTAQLSEWVLYLRKSNGRKAVPRQRALTSVYIEERLGGRIVAEFPDADRTAFRKIGGAHPRRDEFVAMLAYLREHPSVGVAAYHADRLTRNTEDTTELIRVCAAGGHLVETQRGGSYDLSTANGRKRFRDDASAAEYEVDHDRERVLDARAEVVAAGRWLGGRRPFGWEPDPSPVGPDGEPLLDDDGKPVRGILRLREPEAGALAKAHHDVLKGRSVASIEREWNAVGLRTTGGKRWTGREVTRVLRRPRNAGLMEHNGKITGSAMWPAIVSETEWRGVVAILSDPARRTSPGPDRAHLLSWIAVCGVCGAPVVCTNSGSGERKRPVYRCKEDTRGHVARDEAAVDEYVTRLVIAVLSRPDAAKVLTPRRHQGDDLAALYRDKAAITALIRERNDLHVQRVINTAELVSGRAELNRQLEAVDQHIAEAGQRDVIVPLFRNPARVWAALDIEQRRAVVRRLFDIRIEPAPKGRPYGWRPGERYFRESSVTVEPKWGR